MVTIWQQLRSLRGRICLMCLGNRNGGDDALGMKLGRKLIGVGLSDVHAAGIEPERLLARGVGDECDHVVFVDAVDFGAAPGSVIFLNASQILARFPQVSTHRLSLGLLGRWIESKGTARAWLLGVQPESLAPSRKLSRSVEITIATLEELLMRRLSQGVSTC